MKCVWFADDGTQFTDEYECEEYERNLKYKNIAPTTRFFDCNGREVPFRPTAEYCERLYYIEVSNKEETPALTQWFDEMGYDSPWDTTNEVMGRWFFDTYNNKWRNINELYDAYKEVLDVFEPPEDY